MSAIKQTYETEIRREGSDPDNGVTFEKYYECFTSGQNSPQNASQLRKMAGGEAKKARAAYRVISNALKPKPMVRTKAEWYAELEQAIVGDIKNKLDKLWDNYDIEVQQLAQNRSQIAEGRVNELQAELNDSDNSVDELEQTLRTKNQIIGELQNKVQQLSKVEERVEQLNIRLEEKQQQIEEKNKQIEEVHQLKQDRILLTAERDSALKELASRDDALHKLRTLYEAELKKNGRLEGELKALNSTSKSNVDPQIASAFNLSLGDEEEKYDDIL